MFRGPEHANGEILATIWPGDTTALPPTGVGRATLYEYVGVNGSVPSLVGVDDGSHHLIGQCGTALGHPEGGTFTSLQGDELFNAISAPDGLRVFFTVAAGPCEEGGYGPPTSELFASEEATGGVRRSIAISEPTTGPTGDCSACETNNPQPAVFQGASEDGSKVFFLSEQHLLAGAEGLTLYVYDFNAERGKRVALVAPGVQGVSRVAENGSRVYFVASGLATGAANPVGDVAQSGADNLFVYDTETAITSFVGTLTGGDATDWQVPDARPVDASPDGRYLVFNSSADLTHSGTGGESQVFEYDAVAKRLVLASEVQGGAGGVFPATIVFPRYTEHVDPSPQPSSVSDDGSVVVFQSDAALTIQAIPGYNNVYEYRAGHVYLISDGQDRSFKDGGFPSVSLVGVDGSGRDIFFTTADQLVPQDGDTQEDVYDARSEGGFLPEQAPVCEGEACQGPLAPALSVTPAGSLGQVPGEQVVEPPARLTKKVSRSKKTKHKVKKTKHTKKKATRARHGKSGAVLGGRRR
jgi:hypothetical protein